MSTHLRSTTHSGLLAISAIGSSINSFLGPVQRVKCVIDDEDVANNRIVSSTVELLQSLDIQHPVGHVLNSSCQSHHKTYGTCTTTMISMAGFMAKAAINLLDQGVPVSAIVETMAQGLEECISEVENLAIPVRIAPGNVNTSYDNPQRRLPDSDDMHVNKEDEHVAMVTNSKRELVEKEDVYLNEEFKEISFQEISEDTKSISVASRDNVYTEHSTSTMWTVSSLPKLPELPEITIPTVHDAGIHSNNDDDEDDDISWYFDGKIPSPPKFPDIPEMSLFGNIQEWGRNKGMSFMDQDEEKVNPVQTVENGKGMAKCTDDYFDTNLDEEFVFSLENDLQGDMYKSQTLKQAQIKTETRESDDEFDWCFETKTSETKTTMVSGISSESEEDEFSECFPQTERNIINDETENSSTEGLSLTKPKNETNTESIHSLNNVKCGEIFHEQQMVYGGDGRREKDDNIECLKIENMKITSQNFETLLSEKLKLKNADKTKYVHNASRHFTSIESIVDQKNMKVENVTDGGSESHDDVSDKGSDAGRGVGREEDENTKIGSSDGEFVDKSSSHDQIAKMDELMRKLGSTSCKDRTTSLLSVENNSRHFRSIDNVVNEQKLTETVRKNEKDAVCDGPADNYTEETSQDSTEIKGSAMKTENNSALEITLADKLQGRNTKLASIQNRSRHFRTIDSVVKEGESPVIKFNTDNQLDNDTKRINDIISPNSAERVPGCQIAKDTTTEAVTAIIQVDELSGLSHGDSTAMEVAMETCKRQMQGEFNINKFDLNLINTCRITGPPQTELTIEDGLIVELEPRHLQTIFDVQHCRHHHILLINGDIKPTSRHTGYKESLSILPVGHIGDIKLKTSWLDDIVQVLQELNIGILAVKGVVDERLHDYCMANQIVVVEKVKYHALQALAISTHANIVIYTTDAIQEDVGTVVSVECWESGWQPKTGVRTSQLKRTAYVKLTTQDPLQTVILCGPSTVKLTILEESFQNCVHRLQDVISTGKILPGGGVPELKAMQCIQRMKDQQYFQQSKWLGKHDYESAILEELERVFEGYLCTTIINSGFDTDMGRVINLIHQCVDTLVPCIPSELNSEKGLDMVYDCYTAKMEAWRSARSLIQLILLSDMNIITGIDDRSKVTPTMYADGIIGFL